MNKSSFEHIWKYIKIGVGDCAKWLCIWYSSVFTWCQRHMETYAAMRLLFSDLIGPSHTFMLQVLQVMRVTQTPGVARRGP